MHRIERTPVIPINSYEHWFEYAEPAHIETWDEKVTRIIQQDKIGDWLKTGVLLFIIAVCLEITWRAVR